MADRTVLVRLRASIGDFKSQMDAAGRSVDGVGRKSEESSRKATTALGQLARSAQDSRQAWDDAGTSMVGFGAVTVAALGATVKAAVDWESAWAGVTKTVDGTPEQLARVEDGLRGLARTLPSTHGEIAAVAEAAGQLGVKTPSIVGFTRTMIDLGQTTNLSADQAATSLAQLMNVMRTAPQDVGRLGAALVALGNDGASTEADILNMASYITGSARLIGASESDVLALANAMTSMGINAERGGGVMTRVMQDVYAAVQTGGDKLQRFADVAGMSSAEFARAFEDDPVRAIDAFIRGLNDVEASGGNVVATLGELGYKGTQDTAVLLQMKGAGDLLTRSLDLGNKAWQDNTALVEEAAKRYDTTASQLAIARNGITDAAIEIGDVFLPVVADLAGGLADVAGRFADLPEPVQATVGAVTGVAGVAALAGGAFLLLFPRVIETYKAFQTLKTDMPGVAGGLGKVGKAAGIAGVVLASASALHALEDSIQGLKPASMEDTTSALLDMGTSVEQLDQLFANQSSWDYKVHDLSDAIERLVAPGVSARFNDFLGEVFTLGSSEGSFGRDRLVTQFNQIGESLGLMVESGNADLAAKQFKELSDRWEEAGGDVDDLRALLPAYGDALKGVENEQRLAAESATGLAGATSGVADAAAGLTPSIESTYGSLAGYAAALGLNEDATEELRKKTEELGSSLASFVDPLGAYTGLLEEKQAAEQKSAEATAAATASTTDSWEDYFTDVSVGFDEYMLRLEEQVAAQANWQTNMLILSGRVSAGTITQLAEMGLQGADLVAQLVNRSDEELDRFDELAFQRSKEATDAWGQQLTLAAPVLAQIGRTAGQGIVAELAAQLAAGTTTVAQIASEYGVKLADGVNPVLVGLGKPGINPRVVSGFADGGLIPGPYVGPTADNVLIRANPREFMQPVASVDYYGQDVMEALRTRRIPRDAIRGYAEGGLVGLGRRLQGMGAKVTGHSAFGGREYGQHGKTSKHYSDEAIDVNTRPGTSALEQRELTPMMELARSLGFRTIFLSAGHFNHGHVDTGAGSSIGSVSAAIMPTLPAVPDFPYNGIAGSASSWAEAARATAQSFLDKTAAAAVVETGTAAAAGAGVERWRGTTLQALARVGQSASLVDVTLRRMNQESGGNPRAINNWDVNAKRGTPSKGLMQVIDPTFRANRDPGLANDIWDPMANIVASMRYALGRYGSLSAAYNRAGGYANGGTTPAREPFWVGERGPELLWSDRSQYVSSSEDSMRLARQHFVDARQVTSTPAAAATVSADQIAGALSGMRLEGVMELRDDGYARMTETRFVRGSREREHMFGV